MIGTHRPKVMFVDDEQAILLALRRALSDQRTKWEMSFAQSGEAALTMMAAQPFDVLLTDMRMPGMSGLQLLDTVRDRYPGVIRLVLTGQASETVSLSATLSAHQFLVKPCSSEVICSTIERALRLRYSLLNPHLIQLVTSLHSLPGCPALFDRINGELAKPEVSLKVIGDLVAGDAAMAARLLQLVNSSFFALSQPIVDISRAVVLLGLSVLKALLLTTHAFQTTPLARLYPKEVDNLLAHSKQVATLAREVARSLKNSPKGLVESSFTAGLLHDLGRLVLLQVKGYHVGVLTAEIDESVRFVREREFLGGPTHCDVGAYLLSVWGLPNPIIEAVNWHHHPASAGSTGIQPLTCVHIAEILLQELGRRNSPTGVGNAIPLTMENCPGLDRAYLEKIKLLQFWPVWVETAHRIVQGGTDEPENSPGR